MSNGSITLQKWPQVSIFPTQFLQITILNLKDFSPVVGSKGCFAHNIFMVAKFFINSAPAISPTCIYRMPIECFPLTYDLGGFKSRINRHLLTVGSF